MIYSPGTMKAAAGSSDSRQLYLMNSRIDQHFMAGLLYFEDNSFYLAVK